MEAKLTLKLDKVVIEAVKRYAKNRNTSLSGLVETYFRLLVGEKKGKEKNYSPLVEELSGIIKPGKKFDFREDYTNYLVEKYR